MWENFMYLVLFDKIEFDDFFSIIPMPFTNQEKNL